MTKGAPLRWMENRYLQRYLRGRGIEIGALWRRFPASTGARVWYLDRLSPRALEQHYPELRGHIAGLDLLAEAAQLPVRPASLDFLIASHVLEHLPQPLLALRAWYDALAPGGVLLLKVPDKRHTFDAPRSRTTLKHLLEEHDHPDRFDRRAHFADWLQHIGHRDPSAPGFDQAVTDLMQEDYSIHFHVWIDEDLREIINFTRQEWRLKWEPVVFWRAHFYRKETTIVLIKT
jgi:SAM-dependent methyltransferase